MRTSSFCAEHPRSEPVTVGGEGAFASSGAAAFAHAHGVVERAARLADAFRTAGAPVVHVWHVDEPGHLDSSRNAELYRSIADIGSGGS